MADDNLVCQNLRAKIRIRHRDDLSELSFLEGLDHLLKCQRSIYDATLSLAPSPIPFRSHHLLSSQCQQATETTPDMHGI
jgi:hypothetical protein